MPSLALVPEIAVDLGERSYPIFIGQGSLTLDRLLPFVKGYRVLVVSNSQVAPLYLPLLTSVLADCCSWTSHTLADGEALKTLDSVAEITTTLLQQRFGRDSCLIALGGGVVGDITGFTAACYQRGVPYIQIPTTLLAQVDSSVGGKTGVNHALGKNMIGAFHQPRAVIIDTNFLKTLDGRNLRAGLAEVIKYGLIQDENFFTWLESNIDKLLALNLESLHYAIERSCRCKAAIVMADERESSGQRALLNLGHTFGHAIEAALGYQDWLHGEAVAVGLLMAAILSEQMGWLEKKTVERLRVLLTRCDLPTAPPSLPTDELMRNMARDKKAKSGRMRLVLLRKLGQAEITDNVDPDSVERIWEEFCHPDKKPWNQR